MNTSEHINELATALAAAQAEMPVVPKKRQGKVSGTSKKTGSAFNYSYAYADISDVLSTVLPVLAKHGLAVVQPTALEGDILIVHTRLMHSSGQWLESVYPVCSLTGDHQSMGAAVTYAKRYALSSLICVASDEDVDGDGAEDVKALAKKVVNGPSKFPEQPAPTLLQRALDDFTGYLMVADKAYSQTKTVDDLNDRAEHYDNADIRESLFPMDADRLKQLYERHLQRIRG